MKRIALATKRHWNWKVLRVLVGLIIPAAFAILPYTLNLQNAYSKTGTGAPFGWLFWTFGLESAILAHFFADVIMHTLIPIIDMQDGETARYLAIAAILVAILATLVSAFRSLIIERHKQSYSHQTAIEEQPQGKT